MPNRRSACDTGGVTGWDDALQLADWRRLVAELYADVRRIAASDPAAAHAHWADAREVLYREHPQSPVPPGSRARFRARHFPYDPALRFEVPLRAPDSRPQGAPRAGAGVEPVGSPVGMARDAVGRPFTRIGRLDIPFASGTHHLALYWLHEYSGGLFLPFVDATAGRGTYGGGRYVLDTAKGADLGPGRAPGTLVIDFNFAYQPSCAFDPRWECPLAPPENRLDVPVPAGERLE